MNATPPVARLAHTQDRETHNSLTMAWLALLGFTLVWDFTGLDRLVMHAIGTPEGFAWRDNWWLSTLLHDRLRALAQVLFVVMLVWASWPVRTSSLPRRERWLLVGLVALSLLAVNLIKINSRTSCPWELQDFGGSARYVSHWLWGVGDGGGGRCFPGGHASSAFAFFALCLPWLHAPSGTKRATASGIRWATVILLAGLVAGGAQTLRGAHHPSHTLWTLLICSGISMAGWQLGQNWLQRGAGQGRIAVSDTTALREGTAPECRDPAAAFNGACSDANPTRPTRRTVQGS